MKRSTFKAIASKRRGRDQSAETDVWLHLNPRGKAPNKKASPCSISVTSFGMKTLVAWRPQRKLTCCSNKKQRKQHRIDFASTSIEEKEEQWLKEPQASSTTEAKAKKASGDVEGSYKHLPPEAFRVWLTYDPKLHTLNPEPGCEKHPCIQWHN
eukprot:scaffold85176_cov16-Tisochrysis_lutea.AAC.3